MAPTRPSAGPPAPTSHPIDWAAPDPEAPPAGAGAGAGAGAAAFHATAGVREAITRTVPPGWTPHVGAVIAPGMTVGRRIAGGWQGLVFEVAVADNDPAQPPTKTGSVLKTVRPGALLAPLEREYEVGLSLNALGHPGFVRTTGALIEEGSGAFLGILLEEVAGGRTLADLLAEPAWADAAGLVATLRATFAAMAAAQGCLGFMHQDLRAANVMVPLAAGGDVGSAGSPPPHPVIIDFGLATFGETFAAGPDTVLVAGRAGSGEEASTRAGAGVPGRPGAATAGAALHARARARAAPPRRLLRQAIDAATLRSPSAGPLELLHNAAWKHKGDVYHLLLDLAGRLDGRVWPADDAATEPAVERLHDLVAHVTGVRPRAWYGGGRGGGGGHTMPRSVSASAGFVAPLERDRPAGRAKAALLRLGAGRQGGALHFLRRWKMLLVGWTRPRCAALTAAEALQAPVFTGWVSWRVRYAG